MTEFRFETARLVARAWTLQDADAAFAIYGDAETMRFIGKPLSLEGAARSFRKLLASVGQAPPKGIFLVVFDKATQHSLGVCAIVQFDAGMARAEVASC